MRHVNTLSKPNPTDDDSPFRVPGIATILQNRLSHAEGHASDRSPGLRSSGNRKHLQKVHSEDLVGSEARKCWNKTRAGSTHGASPAGAHPGRASAVLEEGLEPSTSGRERELQVRRTCKPGEEETGHVV